jgi:HlyD family secretion protein
MKKKVFIVVGVVLVAVIAILIIKPFGKKDSVVTFETIKVERGNISNTVTATGTIEAVTSVDVGTQVSGIIDKVFVDFNQRVKKGQMLALIDKQQLEAQRQQSEASLAQAQAQLTYQEANYNRLKALFEKKLIAQSDYDQALYNYDNAKANVKNAKSSYDKTLVNLNYANITSPIDGVVLNRAVEEGQTVAASFNTPTLFTIVNDLTQMEVETSVDEADIGKVKKGQRVEFTVDAYSDIKFEGEVAEVRLQPTTTNNVVTYNVILSAPNPDEKLMPGMTASATIYVEERANTLVLSGKAMRFTPDEEYLQKIMEERMKNLPDSIKERIPEGGQIPQGGAYAQTAGRQGSNASMQSEGSMNTNIALPEGAPSFGSEIREMSSNMKTLYIKDEKGNLSPKSVKIGIDNGTDVEILSGLNEGEEVIISMDTGKKKETTTTQQNQGGPRGPFGF